MGNIRVRINGVTREYEEGVTYRDVAKDIQGEFEHEILLMIEGGTLKELYKKIEGDSELIPLTAGDETGRRTYTRGVIFLMLCAVYETIGKELVEKIRVEYSIGNGIYCEIDSAEGGLRQFTEKELEEVKKRMKEVVSLDLPIVKRVGVTLDVDFPDTTITIREKERIERDLDKSMQSAVKRAKNNGRIILSVRPDKIVIKDNGMILSKTACDLLSTEHIKVESRVGFGTTCTISSKHQG